MLASSCTSNLEPDLAQINVFAVLVHNLLQLNLDHFDLRLRADLLHREVEDVLLDFHRALLLDLIDHLFALLVHLKNLIVFLVLVRADDLLVVDRLLPQVFHAVQQSAHLDFLGFDLQDKLLVLRILLTELAHQFLDLLILLHHHIR